MHFSTFSKVLIGIIIVFTVASVVVVGKLETHYASEAVKMQQEIELTSKKRNEAIINSLTNMTQNVSFSDEEPAMVYTG